jgi:hypothetical protein
MSKTIMLDHNLVLIHVLDCSRCFFRTLFRFKKCRITPNTEDGLPRRGAYIYIGWFESHRSHAGIFFNPARCGYTLRVTSHKQPIHYY